MFAADEQVLPPRALWLMHLRSLSRFALGTAPATLVAFGFLAMWVGPWAALGLGAVALVTQFLLAVWWPALAHARFRWQLREDALLVTRGVLVLERTAIPLGRVQHVDVRQGPIERGMGLASVHVYTASGADGSLPGLELADAERLRDELVARTGGEDDGV